MSSSPVAPGRAANAEQEACECSSPASVDRLPCDMLSEKELGDLGQRVEMCTQQVNCMRIQLGDVMFQLQAQQQQSMMELRSMFGTLRSSMGAVARSTGAVARGTSGSSSGAAAAVLRVPPKIPEDSRADVDGTPGGPAPTGNSAQEHGQHSADTSSSTISPSSGAFPEAAGAASVPCAPSPFGQKRVEASTASLQGGDAQQLQAWLSEELRTLRTQQWEGLRTLAAALDAMASAPPLYGGSPPRSDSGGDWRHPAGPQPAGASSRKGSPNGSVSSGTSGGSPRSGRVDGDIHITPRALKSSRVSPPAELRSSLPARGRMNASDPRAPLSPRSAASLSPPATSRATALPVAGAPLTRPAMDRPSSTGDLQSARRGSGNLAPRSPRAAASRGR